MSTGPVCAEKMAIPAVRQEILIGIRTNYYIDRMAAYVNRVNRLRVKLLGSIFSGSEATFDYCARAPLILVTARCATVERQAAEIDGVITHRTQNGAAAAAIGSTVTAAVATTEAHTLALSGETDTAMLVKFLAILWPETEGPPRQLYEGESSRMIHTQALLALADRLVDALEAPLSDRREFTREASTPTVTATWHRHWESFLAGARQGDSADPRLRSSARPHNQDFRSGVRGRAASARFR
ncbi:hypothetical protein OH799_01575 [Nocardia sp. NBC_00881]|uniref:hypothetical protein n=1 Tax=Nocardia sp. NBC_00881 TaxID=2975995 RepID=UPI00386AFA51|nr:hypothetical protein OH799_01575 [Nocardia sp. NBC_00881]